jgi:hypothetical protein
MRLFKYVEPERVDILENERIAITPPERFKDPFEFRPQKTLPDQTYFKQAIKKAAEQEQRESPEFFRGVDAKRISKIEESFAKNNIVPFAEQFQDFLPGEISKHFGVLCLSTNNNENLMWYHYADGHRGFVIEFESEHKDFQEFGTPYEVIYSDKPSSYNFENPSPDFWRVKPFYLKYEAEYRILFRLPNSTPYQKGGKPLYLARLPRACVKAVYLGHRMEKGGREKILQLLKGTSVSKFDAIPSREDYTISFPPI